MLVVLPWAFFINQFVAVTFWSFVRHCFALPFCIWPTLDRPVDPVRVRITLPIKFNGHRFPANNKHFWGPQAQWPPVVCCVFTVIVVRAFCLCQVNFISTLFYFFFSSSSSFAHVRCILQQKQYRIFDENLWSVELTHLTAKWADVKKKNEKQDTKCLCYLANSFSYSDSFHINSSKIKISHVPKRGREKTHTKLSRRFLTERWRQNKLNRRNQMEFGCLRVEGYSRNQWSWSAPHWRDEY